MENIDTSKIEVGGFRTFGQAGVAYEILEEIDQNTVKIRVIETGEIVNYSREQVAFDPTA